MQMAVPVADILAEAGIRLKSLRPGSNEHICCPKCDGGHTRETSLSVSIDADGDGATWVCHRGSCGWTDGARVSHTKLARQDAGFSMPKPGSDTFKVRAAPVPSNAGYQSPAPHTEAQTANRPDWLYQMFAERQIGARTVHELGIYATERNFPHPVGRSPAIVFPYTLKGDVVNRKFRPHPAKNPMMQERDALPSLFNIDRLGDAPDEIVWVEGEMDVAALFECGIRHAVTLKDGAPAGVKPETDPDAKRFAALRTHADVLEKARRIVLAGDMDAPGLALREELARRLGRHRCLTVDWPNGLKDACEVLKELGPDAVTEAIANAQHYPIDGLQKIRPGTLAALRSKPPPSVMSTGTRASDNILKLPTEGRLIIVTGDPSHGKTTWTKFAMIHTAENHDRRWAVFSPEMQPWEQFAADCAQVWCGKSFWPLAGLPSMSEAEIQGAERWLENRVTMIVCDAEDEAPTLDWLIERARAAVLRDGVTDLLIDPWNEIDHQRGVMAETDYIGRALQRLKAFALRHGCNVWIVAHPAKPPALRPGDQRPAPGPYDLSGSAHWANKSDLGITLHSPKPGTAELHVWKTRHRRRGKRGNVALLDFDELTGRYSTTLPELVRDDSGAVRQDTD